MNSILTFVKTLISLAPFVLLVLLIKKRNLPPEERSKQCYMPIVAVVFSIVAGLLLNLLVTLLIKFLNNLDWYMYSFADWLKGLFDGSLGGVASIFSKIGDFFGWMTKKIDVVFWSQTLVNAVIVILYLMLKKVVMAILMGICKDEAPHYERFSGLVYRRRSDGRRYLKPHMAQGVTFLKVLFYASVVLGVLGTSVSVFLLKKGIMAALYYPVFSIIMVGELYFFLDGPVYEQEESTLSGEADDATRICDYTFMRQVLSRNFGDKLMSDNTSINSDLMSYKSYNEVISDLLEDERTAVEAYGLFMKKKAAAGLDVDENYLASGLSLLNGKSVVFNNPFYYDLVPYVFFPMNRTILRRRKVLIVLGRHAIEEDVATWCRNGLASVTNIPELWNVGVLSQEVQNLDVGIVTRSSVHDLKMHEQNAEFFKDVEFVVLIEPSRLVATAQIGLNSLVRHCRRDGKKLVFCTTDKNCDGLVDALSHILMTSLEEVSATNKHKGTSSYMCWEADEEHLQHRMLPNLSRYLGVGTELSFSALKNQISKTSWYGGEAFPVSDMHWVAKQYYYDLLRFASLPTSQATFDEVFSASPNMWDAQVQENAYLTVEDENFNMYEAKRAFSTRTTNQGFINVISTDYLLKDYMAANDGIFDADSKAIPYIVADYAHTERNVIYRLCLRLTSYPLLESDIRREMGLINIDLGENMVENLWSRICKVAHGAEKLHLEPKTGKELLKLRKNGREYTFTDSVIASEKRYFYRTGKIETLYFIKDPDFVQVFLDDLCSAEYVAEDETDTGRYLGSELRGHIFQKYLPGQFFTFGGKYYEMLHLALDGRVMVRRAADHISGRPQYRQVRNYRLTNVKDGQQMGDCKDIGGIQVTRQYADIQVDTPAYWRMQRYNDFSTGKKISINGVPTRSYCQKQLLRIDFPQELVSDKKTLDTLALLMNEVFRSLYAENQGLVAAVTLGEAAAPLSYSLEGDGILPTSLYVIEDSQMDVGFLVSVERNLTRIFSIICDYLQWHTQTLEESLKTAEEEERPDYTISDEERAAEEAAAQEQAKQKGFRGLVKKVGNFFKKIGKKLGGFFGKLFKRKPKEEKVKEPKEKKPGIFTRIGNFFKNLFKRKPKKAPEASGEEDGEAPAEGEEETPAESDEELNEEASDEEIPDEEISEEEETGAETEQEPEEPEEEPEEETEHPVLMNIAPPSRLYSLAPTEEELEEEIAEEAEESDEEQPVSDEETEEAPASDEPAEEPEEEELPALQRKPYHQRYYLLFGGEEEPENLNIPGTLELLQGLGFAGGALEQARRGLSEVDNVEKNFMPQRKGIRYCDFCGTELFGSEYELLADGRERCMVCSRTAVKTEKEFKVLYNNVIRNLSSFFGIHINVPVKIQMVNAKKLHKALGQTFIPTGQADGRVLGVAIHDKKEGYTILLENGSPKLSASMTMVHELTHIWQYLNWNAAEIKHLYGERLNLEVYEGMAKWVEIQYAYLIGEKQAAKREEIITRLRQDPYGFGFLKYADVYPLSTGSRLKGITPFDMPKKPL